jgi:hypothetical protein
MNTPNLCPQCGKPNTECNCQSDWANSINETVASTQPIDEPYREQYPTYLATSIIVGPGKFEGERIYVPFYYDSWGNGCASEDFGNVAFFAILEDEREAFPELGSAYGLALEESEQGFVHCSVYQTREQYEAAVCDAEKKSDKSDDAEVR